jgi:Tol biopolymer transport system component
MLVYQTTKELFLSVRGSRSDEFPPGSRLPAPVNGQFASYEPFLTADGRALYFSSDQKGNVDIFVTQLLDNVPVGDAIPLSGVNTGAYDGSPLLSRDGLTLYYQSDSPAQVWVAHRDEPDGAFQNAHVAEGFEHLFYVWPEALSPDGCTIYFAGVSGSGINLRAATRQPQQSNGGPVHPSHESE